jgi:hypothetical protein
MRHLVFVLLLLFAAALPAVARQDGGPGTPPGMASQFATQRMSAIRPGLYTAGDHNRFTLEPYGVNKFLLRFSDNPETFVLTMERGSLGTKTLKYDTGATVLRVSVWGGITLYTADAPQGLPTDFQSDAPQPQPLAISSSELTTAFGDESSHMSYVWNLALKFSSDPFVVASDPETRGCVFETMITTATGIERYLAAQPLAHQILGKRIDSVKVVEGGKPTVTISGQTLMVSFVPGESYEGHESSLVVEQDLATLLTTPPRDVMKK